MKKMRLLTATFLLASMFIGFNACSSDNKDDEGKVEPKGKRLVKIEPKDPSDEETTIFTYSKDGLSGWKFNVMEGIDEGASGDAIDLKITSKDKDKVVFEGISETMKMIQIYKLNSQGLAISCDAKNLEGEEDFSFKANYKYSDGYLTSIFYEIFDHHEEVLFKYENGNIIETEHRFTYPNDEYNFVYKFEYGDDLNRGSILSNITQEEEFFTTHGAFRLGIFGKATTNLVKRCTIIEEGQPNNIISYAYTFDNEGYVKTINDSQNKKLTYFFE